VIEVNAEGDASYPACLPKLTDGFFNASADPCLPMMGLQWQECAKSGLCRTVWRTGRIRPFAAFAVREKERH
jgi:hypothetical protein